MQMISPPRSPIFRSRGVTLIEACVAIAIVAIVAASAAPGLQSLIDARRLDGVATQLATDLQFVRGEAVARNLPLRLSVEASAAGTCYVVHTGNAGDCHCAASGPALCTGGAEAIKTTLLTFADRVGLASNAGSLLFDPVHGTCTPTASLRLIDPRGREVRHIVNVMGRVRSCSPDAAVPGYRPC